MAMSNVALFGGAFLTPVIAGKITTSMGWEWTFNFVAIFAALAFPFVFFFVPETAFKRADHLNTDIEGDVERRRVPRASENGQLEGEKSYEHSKENGNENEKNASEGSDSTARVSEEAGQQDIPPKVTFLQSLKIFNGRKTDENFFKLLLRPLPLFFHPGILYVRIPNHLQQAQKH